MKIKLLYPRIEVDLMTFTEKKMPHKSNKINDKLEPETINNSKQNTCNEKHPITLNKIETTNLNTSKDKLTNIKDYVDVMKLEDELATEAEDSKLIAAQAGPRKYEIVYKNIFIMFYLHVAAFYGFYLCFTSAKWATILFSYLCYVAATIGVTAGAHRLWSHKCYKAKRPLQIILIVFLSIANQRATHWVRDHRTHHKYSDTDADPHNASRGFFYSHLGWLFVRKHPEVKKQGKKMDLSDLYNNPDVMFQHRNAKWFIPIFWIVLPTLIPIIFWSETLHNSWHLVIMRYVFNFHIFFLINSAAHIFGNKPYDKDIMSADNSLVSMVTFGEGYHNYHHVFPWDYRSAELGNPIFNYCKLFIDLAARIGWAYDLKIVPDKLVISRALRTGDATVYRKEEKAH